jgi:hypothetical protein
MRATSSMQVQSDRVTDDSDQFNRHFRLLAEKQATARSGSLAYIRPHPGSFETARDCVKHPYFEEVL